MERARRISTPWTVLALFLAALAWAWPGDLTPQGLTRPTAPAEKADDAPIWRAFQFNFPFYGTLYNGCWVCPDGNLVLGNDPNPGDGIAPTEPAGLVIDTYPAAFLENPLPRIAALFVNLVKTADAQMPVPVSSLDAFTVKWTAIPQQGVLGPDGSHTFDVTLYFNGKIEMHWGETNSLRWPQPYPAVSGVPSDWKCLVGIKAAGDAHLVPSTDLPVSGDYPMVDSEKAYYEQYLFSTSWDRDKKTISFLPENDLPEIVQGETISVAMVEDQPETFNLTLSANDLYHDTLIWSIAEDPVYPEHGDASVTGNSLTAKVSYTPDPNYYGQDQFTVKVVDSGGLFDTIVVNVTITGVNDKPVITDTKPYPISTTEGGTKDFVLHATDAETGVLTWSVNSVPAHGDAVLIPGKDASSATFRYTHNGLETESDEFEVKVADSGGLVDTIVVNVTITGVNDKPVVDQALQDKYSTQGIGFSYQFDSKTFRDPDGDPLSYSATLESGESLPDWLVFNGTTRTFSGTPTAEGILDIRVTASDGEFSASDEFTLTILGAFVSKQAMYFPRMFWDAGKFVEGLGFVNTSDAAVGQVRFTAYNSDGGVMAGPVFDYYPAKGQTAKQADGLLELKESPAEGWVLAETDQPNNMFGLFLTQMFDALDATGIPGLDGAPVCYQAVPEGWFPRVKKDSEYTTVIFLANPHEYQVDIELMVTQADGSGKTYLAGLTLPGHGCVRKDLTELVSGLPEDFNGALRLKASAGNKTVFPGVVGNALLKRGTVSISSLNLVPSAEAATTLFVPHVTTDGYTTDLMLTNPNENVATVTFTTYPTDAGSPDIIKTIGGNDSDKVTALDLFGTSENKDGWVKVTATAPVMGSVTFGTALAESSMPLPAAGSGNIYFAQVANGYAGNVLYWTGLALVNPGDTATTAVITVRDTNGTILGEAELPLAPGEKFVSLLDEVPGLNKPNLLSGSLQVVGPSPLLAFELFGNLSGDGAVNFLSAVPAQSPGEAPAAPEGLMAEAVSPPTVAVPWTWPPDKADLLGFDLYRKVTDQTDYQPLAVLDAGTTTYPDTGVAPDTTYWYKVRSYNGVGESTWSNEDDATTPASTFTILATAEPGGIITPSGEVPVAYNGNQSFTITPDPGNQIREVMVDDDTPVGAVTSYTFTGVTTAGHTIAATFNRPPAALDDPGDTTPKNTPLTVPAPGVLGNDADPDNDALTAAKLADPANGSLTLNQDGSFTYEPNRNYFGTDSFTYTVSDGQGGTDDATVSVEVSPVNNDELEITQGSKLNIQVPMGTAKEISLDAIDPDLTPPSSGNFRWSVAWTDPANHGIATISPTAGSSVVVTYTPAAGYTGQDKFTINVLDDTGAKDSIIVNVTVVQE